VPRPQDRPFEARETTDSESVTTGAAELWASAPYRVPKSDSLTPKSALSNRTVFARATTYPGSRPSRGLDRVNRIFSNA